MTLGVHAIVGAALGRVATGNPLLAFAIGFASHFACDALPHFDYKIRSARKNEAEPLKGDIAVGRDLARDLPILALDCIAGFVASYAIFRGSGSVAAVLAGAVGGVLPDALQFVYYRLRREPLTSLQRFHNFIGWHSDPNWVLGVSSQVAAVALSIALSFALAG